MKKKLLAIAAIAAAVLTTGMPVLAATPETYTVTVTDVKTNEKGDYIINYEDRVSIDGAVYVFDRIEYNEKTTRETRELTSQKMLISEGEQEQKRETVVEGVKYILTAKRQDKETVSNRTVTLTDELERNAVTDPTAKESVEQEVEDEITGEKFVAVLPLKDSVHDRTEWIQDMTFQVRFDGYNEPLILFMGSVFPRNDAKPLSEEKYPLLLQYASLSPRTVRITDVRWNGNTEQDATGVYRNATAYAETLHEVYKDSYETEYTLPDLTYVTYSYQYTEADESYYLRKTADATIYYRLESKNFTRALSDFVSTPLGIATICVVAAVIIGLIVLFIILGNARRKKNQA